MGDFSFRTIDELRDLLDRGDASARELATASLDELGRLGGPLGAVATLLPERAMAAAGAADSALRSGRRSRLLGVPYAVKDIVDVAGTATTCGTAALADDVRSVDATVVSRLDRAGGVLTGKLALVELIGLQVHDPRSSLHGPARNPWAADRWAGGSSGGSAIAVAIGALPAAVGSETCGSIGAPAAWCGVTGFRPTAGRVSRRGVAPLAPSLDKVGVLGRSAADCAHMLATMSGRDSADPESHGAPITPVIPPETVRVGWSAADFDNAAPHATRSAFHEPLDMLGQLVGPFVDDIALPEGFDYRDVVDTIMGAEGSASFRRLVDDGTIGLVSDRRAREYVESAPVSARDYLRALDEQARFRALVPTLFGACDVIVTTNFVRPWPIPPVDGEWDPIPIDGGNTAMVWASNLAGLPAVFLPAGFVDGLPVSIQLVGSPGRDSALLALAAAFQRDTTWHLTRPSAC